jgi:hypothetical protein
MAHYMFNIMTIDVALTNRLFHFSSTGKVGTLWNTSSCRSESAPDSYRKSFDVLFHFTEIHWKSINFTDFQWICFLDFQFWSILSVTKADYLRNNVCLFRFPTWNHVHMLTFTIAFASVYDLDSIDSFWYLGVSGQLHLEINLRYHFGSTSSPSSKWITINV